MGSWDKEITEFLALLPSSFSVIPPVFPPNPPPAHPHQQLSICCFVFAENRSLRGGSSSAPHPGSLFLPAAQLAAWATGSNSPSCDFCGSSSQCSTAPPSSGQPSGIPWGLQPERPTASGFPAVAKAEFCPNRGKRKKEERERVREKGRDREAGGEGRKEASACLAPRCVFK